jgi:mRNA-degrading endonuclease YafQ of YafQ-DinJ toxin-antitoxin module
MREIFTTGRFDKRLTAFIHRHPELNAETRSVMELIAKDPAHPRCARISSRDRSPSASHLGSSREYRIVFIFDAVSVVFLDIGTHDDVYR